MPRSRRRNKGGVATAPRPPRDDMGMVRTLAARLRMPGLCLALAAGCFCGAAHAAFPLPVEAGSAEVMRSGVEALRALPRQAREACIAEKLGLLFLLPDGEKKALAERAYVGGDAAIHRYESEVAELCGRAAEPRRERALWEQAQQAIEALGARAVLAHFGGEVTRLVQQTAAYHLRSVPEGLRDACLAQWAGLLYTPEGDPLPPSLASSPGRGLLFIDSHADVLAVDELWRRWGSDDKYRPAMETAARCAELVGAEDLLELFPVEVNAMLRYREDAPTPLPGMGEVFEVLPVDSPAVAGLKSLPRTTRWAFLAGALHLTFMPDGAPAEDARFWIRPGASFVGSDGQIYDYWSEHCKTSGDNWLSIERAVRAEGREAVFAVFDEEVRAMRLAATALSRQRIVPESNFDVCPPDEGEGFVLLEP